MKLIQATIERNCEIVLHGDTHIGNAAIARTAIEHLISWIGSRRRCYWIHMGDEQESIMVDDPRFDLRAHASRGAMPVPLLQSADVELLYKPIAKKGLVWLNGNHNYRLHNFGDITEELCRRLGVPYGTWTCKLALHDQRGRLLFKMFLVHGYRRRPHSVAGDVLQRQTALCVSLKRLLAPKAGDCLVMAMGHIHMLLVVPPAERLTLWDDGKRIRARHVGAAEGTESWIEPDRRWYVSTGCFERLFVDGMTTYPERAGLDPVDIGYALMRIEDGKVVEIRKVLLDDV